MKSQLILNNMNDKEKYILERIERLYIEVKQNMLPKSKKRYMILKYSRPIFEMCTNIINLIEIKGYTNYLDKESEAKALDKSRDYLKGSIDIKQKNDRMKFLKQNNEVNKYNKFSYIPINYRNLYIDSSAIIHDNQISYKYYPKKEYIQYIDNVLLYLITHIYLKLCSKYKFNSNNYINKLHQKLYSTLHVENKLTLKKKHKKILYNEPKRIGG